MIVATILFTVLVLSPTSEGQRVKRQGNFLNQGESCSTPRPGPGVCIDIKQCPSLLTMLRSGNKSPEVVQYLQNSVCSYNGNVPIVCCPTQTAGGVSFDQASSSCTTPKPESKPGTCINIKKCPVAIDILRNKRNDKEAIKYLQSSVCYYEGKDPVVCCRSDNPDGNKANNGNTNNGNTNNGNTNNVSTNSGNVNTATGTKFPGNKVCGLSSVQHVRVVGGQPAALGSWPWIAALGYITSTKPTPEWLCGGALISERYIVTAAHCVVNTGRRVLTWARLGDLNLDDSVVDGATPVNIKVEKAIPHEKYNAARHTTDIALLRLSQSVTFSKLIVPICLPFQPQLRSNPFVGYTPFLAGWGALSYKGPSTPILQEVQIDISDIPGCIKAYSNITGATIDNRVICAGRTGKDACQGDSGGPLMLPRGENFYLIGVVSYGYKCADPGYPGIYTRVTEFVDWIDKNAA